VQRIELDNVARVFGRTWALNRVRTTFRAGRIAVLLGPNGAGKSTMIRLMATLDTPDRGTITYDERSHVEMARKQRGTIGYVSHDALLYLDLTGHENLTFYARLYGIDDAESRIAGLLSRVDLTEAADRVVRGYSRGMRQRLTLARALLHRPEVLLLDEPFTGLDRWGEAALHEILDSQRAAGRIIVLSTHRLEMPSDMCDEVRILRRGRLLVDRPLDAGERIADVYAEAFSEAAQEAAT